MTASAGDSVPVYDRLAEFYDWEHRDFRDDLPLYLGLARAAAGRILEAACGTGRLLIPLAEAGHPVTGVDASEAMLRIAGRRVRKERYADRVRLVRADLRTMELGESFGMAFVALGSFHHLLTADDQRNALQRMAEHISTGGVLVLDLVNPSPEWLAAGDGAVVHQATAPFPSPDGPDLLQKFVARTTHFDVQQDRSLLVYDRIAPDGTVSRCTFPMDTRFIFRYEAELLLAREGFQVRDLFGDYQLGEYHSSSPRMIFVAERR